MAYVFSYEYLPNRPIREGGKYHGLKMVEREAEMLDFAITNLNYFHILDVIDTIDEKEIEFEYESENHRYSGIKYHVDFKLVKKTVVGASGRLVWENIEK